MNTSAEQLIGRHTRAVQTLDKAMKGRAKLSRRLDELGWDDEATMARFIESDDRLFEAEAEIDRIRAERMAFIDALTEKRRAAEITLASAHASVKLHQASIDRFEADINRLRYL